MEFQLPEAIKAQVRTEAEKGARKAVTTPVTIAILLALYAVDQATRKKRRR